MTLTPRMTRRTFLRIVGIAGVAGGALKLGLSRPAVGAMAVTETRLLMGTVVNLTLVASDRVLAQAAMRACLDEMAALEGVLSRYRPDSALSHLNRDGRLDAPDPHLVAVLGEAVRLSTLTDGAFDVTVKPLADLYRQYQQKHALPPDDAIQAALGRTDYRLLDVSEHRITLARSGMGVTLDGIAKGYIVDQGTAILRAHDFDHLLVEAGGDLVATGSKTADTPWRVGIREPRGAAKLLYTFGVADRAVATSGDYMQPYSDDLRHHHILDPRTGHSGTALASATVVGATGMQTDALATALMVMEPERGLALVETLPACEAYLVTKDRRVLRSTGIA